MAELNATDIDAEERMYRRFSVSLPWRVELDSETAHSQMYARDVVFGAGGQRDVRIFSVHTSSTNHPFPFVQLIAPFPSEPLRKQFIRGLLDYIDRFVADHGMERTDDPVE